MSVDERARGLDSAPPEGAGTDPYAHLVAVQEVFEFAPSGNVRTDGAGVVLEANQIAALLFRCRKEFLIGKPLGLFVAEGHRGLFYSALTRLLRGSAGEAFECPTARSGTDRRDVAVFVTPEGRRDSSQHRGSQFRWHFADITDRNRAEADRDELLRRLVAAHEGERRRMARELHDTFGQLLTALSLEVGALRGTPGLPPEAAGRLADVDRTVGELYTAAHDLAVRLRPTALDDLGLSAAVGQLAAEWSRRTGVPVTFDCTDASPERLPPEVETALYRSVQEALTNVARHAGASQVGVVVGRSGGHAIAVVEDNGRGFDPDARDAPGRPGGLGLAGIRERVNVLGGRLEIESSPGGGTTVLVRISLAGPGNGSTDARVGGE